MKKEIIKLLKNSPLYPFLRSTKRTLRIYKEYHAFSKKLQLKIKV